VTDSALGSAATGSLEHVVLPAVDPAALAVADLVLGVPGGLVWPGPDGPVALNPTGRFSSGAAAELYYRAGGLAPDSTYRTTIEVRTPGKDRSRRIVSAFGMVAREARQVERRRIVLRSLRPGDYELSVTVSGQGRTATSTIPLRVR
jgi:hypothetical protein